MLITFVLLGASIASVWLPSLRLGQRTAIAPWAVLHGAAVAAGLASGVLAWPAVAALSALAGLCWGAERRADRRTGWAWSLAAGTLALALALHAVPGFHNPSLLDSVRTSPQAIPFTLYANFDKASAGLFLLVFFAPRLPSFHALRAIAVPTITAFVVAAAATLGLAWTTGQVRPDAKVPAFSALFLAVNLLFTCVAEEAFFRGWVQERLTRALASRPSLAWVPVAASTLFFALAHAGGGPGYVALAGLAGWAYALVYALTRRIEAAVLTHFLVNASHFLLFTYPMRSG
ncbi:MAG: CPBP family intramembrane metalloprotease [Rubrivivax sp.]|nr:MAG: CPBP family intramembrane metalloprotease [Rubrivivax sp.]